MNKWTEVQAKAATKGSTVLARFMEDRARLKNATYSSDVMESFGVYPQSSAGLSVTPESAMRVSAVFACVQRIAGTIATLPLHVYERTEDGRRRVDAPIWWLLNESPTARYTAASHWESTSAASLLRGDSFTFIGRDALGNIKELIPLPWECVQVQRDLTQVGGRLKYFVNDVRTFGVDAGDMLHFPGFGFSGVRSMSVIQYAARNATGTAAAMDEYSGRFFQGGAHPSIVLQTDKTMNKEAIANLQSAFSSKYSGAENAHRLPLVLTEGLTAQPLSISAEDSQLLEARKFQVIDIARAFGVPPHLIGETSAATSWGSGIESMSRGFITYTLQPHLRRIEQELNRKLWPIRTKYFVEFDRDALIEGDSGAQAAYFRAALGGPGSGCAWMTVDEVRKSKNLKPMGGDSAELYDPRDGGLTPAETAPAEPSASEAAVASMAASVVALASREAPANVINMAPTKVEASISLSTKEIDDRVGQAIDAMAHAHAEKIKGISDEMQVTVNVPQQAAPIVNVAAPIVNFEAVMPEQAAPIVNVEAPVVHNVMPDEMRITAMPTRVTTSTVNRDRNGNITAAVNTEQDA